jgi:peptidoglycan/xylan/chitin deacetylase (PgdA/CDA1 family)
MHEFNLKMIKIILVIIAIALFFGMVGGVYSLRDNYYMRVKYFVMQFDYLKTKIAFGQYYYGGTLPWIGNLTAGIPQQQNSALAQSVPVLLYHGVIDTPGWKSDGTNISLSDFQSQMFALKKAGYNSITLAQFLDFMQSGKPLPANSILITFDDSRADSYYPVDPILRVLGYNAVMFVITGRSIGVSTQDSNFHLSQEDLEHMLASGRWELASHTQNGHGYLKVDANGTQADGHLIGHFMSDKQWLDGQGRLETDQEYYQRVSADLIASKKDLENSLGIKVLGFAYPFGDYGNDTQNFPGSKDMLSNLVNSLFPLSFRQVNENEFPVNYPGKDFRLVKRIDVNEDMSKDQLLSLLNYSREKSLPYSDSFSTDNGWLTAWGSSQLKNGLLLTQASATEDSSMTFLNGTFNWKNYIMDAKVRTLQGNSFALAARYSDGNNYVSCDFTSEGATLSQSIAGVETAISQSDQNIQIMPNVDMETGIGVSGNLVTCYIGGKAAVSGNISPSLSHGGIAFKTWGNGVNNSSLLVSSLRVNMTK